MVFDMFMGENYFDHPQFPEIPSTLGMESNASDKGKQHAVFRDVGCRYDELHKYSQLADTYTTHTSRNGLNYWPYFSSWISVCTSIAGTTLGPEAFQNIQALIISYNAVKNDIGLT
jgi:hypothetical protein